jgi:integrase
MAYPEKRKGPDGKHYFTGSWVGEAPKAMGKKRRFKTERDARDYETFCKLMGREPPTIEDGMQNGTGAPTFAEVAQMAKDAGGPKGKWKAERDHSLMQRIDYCVGIIGTYEIQRVTRSVLKKITDSLERAKAPGKSHQLNSNAVKNRYLSAASSILTFAVNEELIETKPKAPWLDEKTDRKERDILQLGQEEVVLKLMREAGNELEALCVEVLIETGIRRGELYKLQPDQVAIEQVQDEDGTDVPVGVLFLRKKQTKNNKSRPVIFPAELAREIKALIASGSLPDGDRLLDTFKDACERAGYTGNLVLHSLRHTRNTLLHKAGVDQSQRKEMLGHMSDAANDIYTHRDLEDQLQAVKKLREYAGKRAKRAQQAPSQVLDFPKVSAGGED